MKTLLAVLVLFSASAFAGKASSTAAPAVIGQCTVSSCVFTGTGLSAGKTYDVEIVDHTSGTSSYHSVKAGSNGSLTYTVDSPTAGDLIGCYIFTISNSGSPLKLVAGTTDLVP